MNSHDFDAIAAELGLPRSRLISFSKSRYHEAHPQHAVVFNATLADAAGKRLWWGDIDYTEDEERLLELAGRVGIDLYLYYEGDSRHGFVEAINPSHAIAVIHADGTVSLGTRMPVKRTPFGRVIRDLPGPAETKGRRLTMRKADLDRLIAGARYEGLVAETLEDGPKVGSEVLT